MIYVRAVHVAGWERYKAVVIYSRTWRPGLCLYRADPIRSLTTTNDDLDDLPGTIVDHNLVRGFGAVEGAGS